MINFEKRVINYFVICFFLVLFLSPFIFSQQIVEVPQNQETNKGLFSGIGSVLTSRIVWGGIIIFVFILVVFIGLFFLVRFLIKFIKSRSDAFYRLKTERLKMAKIQRRYPSKSWYKIKKNTPIRLVKRENNRLVITKPIAYHRGDYVTHEGNIVVSLNLVGYNKWFFLPLTDLLVIPNKESIELAQRGEKGKREVMILKNLPKPDDIIRFNEDEILIFADSLSRMGMFLIPVLTSKEGKVVDLSMPVFESLKRVVLEDYLFEQTAEFGTLAKQGMNINPFIRASQKVADTSQSVDIPTQNERR